MSILNGDDGEDEYYDGEDDNEDGEDDDGEDAGADDGEDDDDEDADDGDDDDDLQVPRALLQDGDKHREQLSLINQDDSDEMLIMMIRII